VAGAGYRPEAGVVSGAGPGNRGPARLGLARAAPVGKMIDNAMPTPPPQPPSRPVTSVPPLPTSARQSVAAAPLVGDVKLQASSATSPRSRGAVDPRAGMDQRVLRAAGSFDVLLRNGQTWSHVRLLDMDAWNLLIETEQGRVLLPKHATDAYLLGRS
jgi:hypothetical protein